MFGFSVFASAASTAQKPKHDALEVVNEFVSRGDSLPGAFIAVITKDRIVQKAMGKKSVNSNDDKVTVNDLSGDDLFEVGSITKAFVGLLLADMVIKKEINLSDTLQQYCPDNLSETLSKREPITLRELVTHSSGLPRLPSNLTPKNMADPYNGYSESDLWSYVEDATFKPKSQRGYEYSNLGMGLLGVILSRAGDQSLEQLMMERIFKPLNMNSTFLNTPKEQLSRLTQGSQQGQQVEHWHFQSLAGAGALISSGIDMTTFLKANMNPSTTKLKEALMLSHQLLSEDNPKIAMAWHQSGDMIWHNGATAGYRSFIGFNPAKQQGILVLGNSDYSLEPVLQSLLVNDAKATREILFPKALDRKIVKPILGHYKLAENFVIAVFEKNNTLYVQATAQPPFEIRKVSNTRFRIDAVGAEVEFKSLKDGSYQLLLLNQGGAVQEAKRVSNKN